MAPEQHSINPEDCLLIHWPRVFLVLLMAILGATPLGNGPAPVRSQADSEHSLTLSSFECAAEIPIDDALIAMSECESTFDRAFELTGPGNQNVDLIVAREVGSDESESPTAVWSADADDDSIKSGSWTLRETEPDAGSEHLVSCLTITGLKVTPARLEYGEDHSVEFEWSAAVALGPDTVAGEHLNCSWYSVPALPAEERPGLLSIRSTTVRDSDDVDLVAVEAEGTPEVFGNTESGALSLTSLTLINDETGRRVRLDETGTPGPLETTTFVLGAGAYTLLVNSTGQRTSFTLDEGQTVLALNRREGSAEESTAPTVTVVDADDTADPTPITIDIAPTSPAPTLRPATEAPPQTIQFSADSWLGAYPDLVTAVYQRECVAIYGASSQYPSATVTFDADATAGGQSELVLTGLDDEWSGQVQMLVTVNGAVVYRGSSGFDSWNPSASQVAWSQVEITFDSELIVDGENEITVTNLAQAANFGTPPYILLAEATVVIGGD